MSVQFHLRRRESVPNWLGYGAPVLTVLAALLVGAVPLVAINANPVVVYEELFIGTVSNQDGIIRVLIRTVPLLLTGLAVYIPLKARLWNIAAEGQLYVGAIVGTWIGIAFSAPWYVLVPLMGLGGLIVGGFMGAVPAYLRAKWGVNEIIVTLMITFAAIEFNEYVIRGPLQGKFGAPASPSLEETATIPTLGGTQLHIGVMIIPVAVLFAYYLIKRSGLGYEIVMVGSNPFATEHSRIDEFRVYMLAMVIGGCLAGLAGMIEISGVQGRLVSEWSPGYGFIAIPIALLGLSGAFRVLLASLFFAVLFVGGNSIAVANQIPFSIVEILIALVFLFLITSEFLKKFKFNVSVGSTTGVAADE